MIVTNLLFEGNVLQIGEDLVTLRKASAPSRKGQDQFYMVAHDKSSSGNPRFLRDPSTGRHEFPLSELSMMVSGVYPSIIK